MRHTVVQINFPGHRHNGRLLIPTNGVSADEDGVEGYVYDYDTNALVQKRVPKEHLSVSVINP